MTKIKNIISIGMLTNVVFAFVSNPINFPLWNYYIRSVKKISSGNDEVGTRYHQVRKTDEQIFAVTMFEINKFIEFKTEPNSSIHFTRQMAFTDENGITVIDDYFEIDSGYPLFLAKPFNNKLKNAVRENLDKLKELLETGRTRLQDGKEIALTSNS
jgi:hypothetical protein